MGGGQNSERFAAGDQQLAAGGEGRDMGTAGEAHSDLRLATSNYLPEGRGGSRVKLRAICGWLRATICRRGGSRVKLRLSKLGFR